MKILIILLTLFSQDLLSEEVIRAKVPHIKVDPQILHLAEVYWNSALSRNKNGMEKVSNNPNQFSIDMAIADQKLKGRDFKVIPTYFEKVIYKKTKITYIFAFDFYENDQPIVENHDCQILEKKKGQFKIIGHISDCVE